MTRGKPKAGRQARVPGARTDGVLAPDELLRHRRKLLRRILDTERVNGCATAGIDPDAMTADELLAEIRKRTDYNDGKAGP